LHLPVLAGQQEFYESSFHAANFELAIK